MLCFVEDLEQDIECVVILGKSVENRDPQLDGAIELGQVEDMVHVAIGQKLQLVSDPVDMADDGVRPVVAEGELVVGPPGYRGLDT